MDKSLCFFVCRSLYPEVEEVLTKGRYTGCKAYELPFNCTGQQYDLKKILSLATDKAGTFGRGIVIGSNCLLKSMKEQTGTGPLTFAHLENCHDILAPPPLIRQLIGQQAYLVSSGWFRYLDDHFREWGFEKEVARKFFRESAKRIVLLDTGISGNHLALLDELKDYMGLPAEILTIGLDYCRLFLKQHIEEWARESDSQDYKDELARNMKRSADYFIAFHEINHLMKHSHEEAILEGFFTVLNMLCAPDNIIYTPVEGEITLPPVSFTKTGESTQTDQSRDFSIELFYDGVIGQIKVIGVRFPEYIAHYEELIGILGRVCSLAVANARKFRDIQEKEKISKEQAQALEELNATKDKLFSIISHDLRSPVATLISYAEILTSDSQVVDEAGKQKILRQMSSLSKNTLALLENLLEWSRIQRGNLSISPLLFDFSSVTEETVNLMSPVSMAKRIDLVNNIGMNSFVFADKDSVRTVLRNLVSNAVKFTRSGGKLELGFSMEDGFARISVKDNGVGIPLKSMDRLFRIDSHLSTPGTAREKGSGLGLSLCHELVVLNGGKMGAESTEGEGSTFWFTLPLGN